LSLVDTFHVTVTVNLQKYCPFLCFSPTVCRCATRRSVFVYLQSRELLHSHDSFIFDKQISDVCG